MQICNACRYCETLLRGLPRDDAPAGVRPADVHYLANLCHNCGACLHACQYAPPHEFAVNVPRAMAQVRVNTYAEYAWPRALGALYAAQRPHGGAGHCRGLALFLVLAIALRGSSLHRAAQAATSTPCFRTT